MLLIEMFTTKIYIIAKTTSDQKIFLGAILISLLLVGLVEEEIKRL